MHVLFPAFVVRPLDALVVSRPGLFIDGSRLYYVLLRTEHLGPASRKRKGMSERQ